MQRGHLVLFDTNIIIEAFRTNCWNAVTSFFTVETVEKCYEEALTGDPLLAKRVHVDPILLRDGLGARHAVSDAERARFALMAPGADALDAGERDLFAHALGNSRGWLASASDRAAIKVALRLKWEERFRSLEVLARAAGARPMLREHFTEKWLSGLRTDYKLETL